MEHTHGHELLPPKVAGKLGPMLGPLPLGAWAVVIGVGFYIGHKRQLAGAGATDTTSSSTTDTTSSDTSAESAGSYDLGATGIPSEMEPDSADAGTPAAVAPAPIVVQVQLPTTGAAPTRTVLVPSRPAAPAHKPAETTTRKPSATARPTATPKTTGAKTYTVHAGDTLAGIGSHTGTDWHRVYDLNKTAIEAAAKAHGKTNSGGGHWIYPGTVLRLP